MQINIIIDDKEQTFVASHVPMRAKRKFFEIRAKEEALFEEHGGIPAKEQIELENELINILVDVVFKNQFTIDEFIDGVTEDYYDMKLAEAIFGKMEANEGNEKGK